MILSVEDDLPQAGMKLDDVHVEIMDGMLHLRGEKRVDVDEKKDNVRLVERRYGAFERSFTLPRSVDPDKVRAEYDDGVLTVHMPKTETAAGPEGGNQDVLTADRPFTLADVRRD